MKDDGRTCDIGSNGRLGGSSATSLLRFERRYPTKRRPALLGLIKRGAQCCGLGIFLALASACGKDSAPVARGDPERGKALAEQVGCGSCHRIPGINAAVGEVGPPLDQLEQRAYLAGVLPNNFDNLILWIAQPQAVAPESAMPNLNLEQGEARDIAAYLYTLK